MRRWKEEFMDTKIRGKLIFSHIVIALIPFFLVGLMGIMVFMREAERNAVRHSGQMVEQVQKTMDVYISGIEKTINFLMLEIDASIPHPLETAGAEIWDEENSPLSDVIQGVFQSHSEIAGVFFAAENDEYLSVGMSRISRDSFRNEQWYRIAMEDPETIHIISKVTGRNIVTDATYSTDDVFSVVKAVVDGNTGLPYGVLLLDVKHDIIASSIQDAIVGSEGFMFILDQENNMVYAPLNRVVYRIRPEWMESGRKVFAAEVEKEKYQLSYERSDYTGWKTVSVTPYKEIMGSIHAILVVYICVFGITFGIVLLVAVKLSDVITKPIIELRNLMKRTEQGDFSVRFEGAYRDEISELGRRFNHMMQRIQELIQRVYQEQEYKRRAELRVVQEQFKPHFLYNTLDTIGWMAREHHAEDIVHMVDALTNVFRLSLSKGKDYVSLTDEIKYITNYLYIQKIRYGAKVQYEVEFDEKCKTVYVPKLILQPLVENAIYHGLKMKRGKGHLKVRVAMLPEEKVLLEVVDDGQGMSREKVEELTKALNDSGTAEENQSFGLFYIKERLRIRYGGEFSVNIESQEGEGTRISLLIPGKGEEQYEKEDSL